MENKTSRSVANDMLDKCEKIERSGASAIENTEARLATLAIIKDSFDMIRKDAPQAYVRLMKMALNQPSSAKQEYINRIAFLARMAGCALMVCTQNEAVYAKLMGIYEERSHGNS